MLVWPGHDVGVVLMKQGKKLNLEQEKSSPHRQNIFYVCRKMSLNLRWMDVLYIHHQRRVLDRTKICRRLKYSAVFYFQPWHRTGQVRLSDQPLKRDCFPPNIQQMGSSGVFVFTWNGQMLDMRCLNGWPWSLCEAAALASLRAKPLAAGSLDRELSSLFS